jgi:hypothetical protein
MGLRGEPIVQVSEPEEPENATDIAPFHPPAALLLIAESRKRAQLHALLTRSGCRCIAARDRAAALTHVRLDLNIGVVITEAGPAAQWDHSIVGELRQHCLRPLAAILLVPEPSYHLLRQIAQSGPADILPETPQDEVLVEAVRGALGWYERSLQIGGLSQNILRILAQIEAQLGRLLTAPEPPLQERCTLGTPDTIVAKIAPCIQTPSAAKPVIDRDTIKALMRVQSAQAKLLGYGLVDDAAWVMLLDLFLMHIEDKPLAVTALCVGSGVPVTTALRRLDQLIAKGLVLKSPDGIDRRRLLVSITPKGIDCVSTIVGHMQGELRAVVAAA